MSDPLHIVCPHCDAVNRIPSPRLGDGPKCGRCHRPLFSATPVELSDERFARHVTRGDLPLLVDFWAPWCAPCRMMAPAFAEAARALEPRVRLAKVNTEEEQRVAAQFGIRSIPTLVLFLGGREVARQAGAMAAPDIQGWVQRYLS